MAITKVSYLNIAPSAASAVTVCASQSPGAGAIVINGSLASGGVATLAAAQLITLVSGGNDTGITFTVTGADPDGNVQTEAITGASAGTATGLKFFKTVTSITHTGSVATTLTSGNSIISCSPTYFPNCGIAPFTLGINMQLVSGTATFALNQVFDDFNTYPADTLWTAHATLTALSATASGSLLYPCTGLRIRQTASSSGVIKAKFVQAGI